MSSVIAPSQHPAVNAWQRLCPDGPIPEAIEILNRNRKCGVYRLTGTGVIAKHARRETALIERLIYQDILPKLPLRSLDFHGFLDEGKSGSCWLFLEDTGGIECSLESETYRKLASPWLALMHASAAQMPLADELPHRDATGFRAGFLRSRAEILQSFGNPLFTAEDRVLLGTIVRNLDCLEAQWSVVEEFCANLPLTLIHNDLQAKNVHIRHDLNGPRICILDWEYAGWGVPCTDLLALDLGLYEETIRATWPALNGRMLQQAADTGRLFQLLSAISWAVEHLAWTSAHKGLKRLQWYQGKFHEVFSAVGLEAG
jgi:Phosphotransferase enzyme family